jgi:hypothetical protein
VFERLFQEYGLLEILRTDCAASKMSVGNGRRPG